MLVTHIAPFLLYMDLVLEEPLLIDQESLEMKRAIHGHGKAHPRVATSIKNLALIYKGQGKLMDRIQFHEKGPVIQRVIHSPNTSHHSTATSVPNLAHAYREFGQLEKAVVMHRQSLSMERVIYGTDAAHPEIVYSFSDLTNVYALVVSVQKTNYYQENF